MIRNIRQLKKMDYPDNLLEEISEIYPSLFKDYDINILKANIIRLVETDDILSDNERKVIISILKDKMRLMDVGKTLYPPVKNCKHIYERAIKKLRRPEIIEILKTGAYKIKSYESYDNKEKISHLMIHPLFSNIYELTKRNFNLDNNPFKYREDPDYPENIFRYLFKDLFKFNDDFKECFGHNFYYMSKLSRFIIKSKFNMSEDDYYSYIKRNIYDNLSDNSGLDIFKVSESINSELFKKSIELYETHAFHELLSTFNILDFIFGKNNIPETKNTVFENLSYDEYITHKDEMISKLTLNSSLLEFALITDMNGLTFMKLKNKYNINTIEDLINLIKDNPEESIFRLFLGRITYANYIIKMRDILVKIKNNSIDNI